jgi:hypothetical protein
VSTGWSGTLDVPTTMEAADAIATMDAILDDVGFRHGEDLGEFHHVSIADGIDVRLPSRDVDPGDGFAVVDGRLVATLAFSNLERAVGHPMDHGLGWNPPCEICDTRPCIEVLFDAITRVCSAPVGTLVGSLQC